MEINILFLTELLFWFNIYTNICAFCGEGVMMTERAWRKEDNCINFASDYCLIEQVLGWLEREDTDVERIAGYGLCLATVTYFLARLFQSLV